MMKKLCILLLTVFISIYAKAQKQDTVIVELAKTSKIIFTIQDEKDLEILKHYDFKKLFEDILTKLENKDTIAFIITDRTIELKSKKDTDDNDNDNDEKNDDKLKWHNHNSWGNTSQSFTFDIGTNNYLTQGKFPDSDNATYTVRPWGSWYFAANSTQSTRLGKKLFLDWGLGVSWYNFKFQNDNTVIQKGNNGVTFNEDNRDFEFLKSKLTASYVNASIIPVVDFSNGKKKHKHWNRKEKGNSFRIGLGPYIGYRIGSHAKQVYKNERNIEKKDKIRDNLYIQNLRYGARLQVGFRGTDLFFNYDLNKLFSDTKGPDLNAFSFGLIF